MAQAQLLAAELTEMDLDERVRRLREMPPTPMLAVLAAMDEEVRDQVVTQFPDLVERAVMEGGYWTVDSEESEEEACEKAEVYTLTCNRCGAELCRLSDCSPSSVVHSLSWWLTPVVN